MISVFVNLATGDEFRQITLGEVNNIILSNDGVNSLQFSHDGKSNKGIINSNETIEFREVGNTCDPIPLTLYIKSNVLGSPTTYRLWGW